MSRSIAIGGIDDTLHQLINALPLAVLRDEVPAIAWIPDCIAQAAAERKGVAIIGESGVGKSIGLRVAIDEFERGEREAKAAHDPYVVRRIVRCSTIRSTTARDMFIEIYRVAFDVSPAIRVHGRTKTDDEIRDELLERLFDEDVAVLVIDEAQTLTERALIALRDLIAVAEDRAPKRLVAGAGGSHYVPSGIGVLLVGTYELEVRLAQSEEAGRRWVRAQRVGAVTVADAPVVFRKLLPAFDKAATKMGDAAWADCIMRRCTAGRDVPIGTIENIIRTYTRRLLIETPGIRTVATIPWDAEIFEQACGELFRRSVSHVRAA